MRIVETLQPVGFAEPLEAFPVTALEVQKTPEDIDAEFAQLVEDLEDAVSTEVKKEVEATAGNKNYGSADNKVREPW